ncbi:MAG: CheR family methyltransferase, partial [Phormidesmis sp.]
MASSRDCPSVPMLDPWLIEAFSQLIADRTGLSIKRQDLAAFCQQIIARTAALNQLLPATYYQLLAEHTPESQQEWCYLSELLTNHESFFFRDKGQFAALKNHILPALIQRKSTEKRLRICSAGCANGEEPYSIAILLKTLLGAELAQWDVMIFGVDISADSIAQAKAGTYREWSFRGLETWLKQIYFHRVNDRYRIDPQFQALVKFYPLNLVEDPFAFGAEGPIRDARAAENSDSLDLIICRNVFIYFDEAA